LNCPLKISAVSYLNTLPFIHSINTYFTEYNYELSLDNPAVCGQKMMNGQADIALVPVALIPQLPKHKMITSYCIGTERQVSSVMLFSQLPLNHIDSIYLDYQSITSVRLLKILSEKFWKISPLWLDSQAGYENKIKDSTAGLIIGDRALEMKSHFKFAYDLGEEWYKYCSFPFVFACWLASDKIGDEIVTSLNDAFKKGLNETDQILSLYEGKLSRALTREYLIKNISYELDEQKVKSMKLFFDEIFQISNLTFMSSSI
jgi:chorismate dehydratase